MHRPSRDTAPLWLAIAVIVGVVGANCSVESRAQQEAAISALTPTLALARTAVREAGIRAYQRDDTAAIHAVISFRAEHLYRTDYLAALRRYTHDAPVRLDAPRPWITQLLPSPQRPPLFPGYLRWEGSNARHWRRTYLEARDVIRGDIENPCTFPAIDDGEAEPATPHDWGSDADAAYYRRRNPMAIELNCGQTCRPGDGLRCEHYFHLPHYEARFGET